MKQLLKTALLALAIVLSGIIGVLPSERAYSDANCTIRCANLYPEQPEFGQCNFKCIEEDIRHNAEERREREQEKRREAEERRKREQQERREAEERRKRERLERERKEMLPKLQAQLAADCQNPDLTDLPPEVYADRKLIEVERQLGEAEYAAALLTMDFIVCYSGRNDIALPAAFYFKQAQISQLAEDGEGAKAAVLRYLKEAGREGENYLEALQMLDELEQ